jgi:uncharacterized protein (DUF4415 family)
MSDEQIFRRAARRVLFDKPEEVQDIPGAGRSAAEDAQRHTRVKITINLDGDVIGFFKEWAKEEGLPYQNLINRVLREYAQGGRPEKIAQSVSSILLRDQGFIELLKKRLSE